MEHYTMFSTRRQILGCFLVTVVTLAGCGAQPDQPAAPGEVSTSAPSGYRVYVTNERSDNLSVIDSATHEVVATIPLGKRPRGIHASPDGKTIYVALSGSPIAGPGVDEDSLPPADKSAHGIGVVDVAQGKLVKVIPGGSDPEEFSLSTDGSLLYSSNEDTGEASIVDVSNGAVVATIKVGETDSEPEGVEMSPDGKFVYVTTENEGAVTVIDTATRKAIKNVKVGPRPRDVAFFPDSSKAYVTCENGGTLAIMDAVKHVKTGEIQIGNAGAPDNIKPMSVVLSPDAKTAYVSAGRGQKVFLVDTATDKVTGSIQAGQRPWGIGLSPDGKYLYTANGPSNDVTIIDVTSKSVVKTVSAGMSPWGVLVLKP
jgi:YVTN family beta-propeller protein